jgi:hypothetical protein
MRFIEDVDEQDEGPDVGAVLDLWLNTRISADGNNPNDADEEMRESPKPEDNDEPVVGSGQLRRVGWNFLCEWMSRGWNSNTFTINTTNENRFNCN